MAFKVGETIDGRYKLITYISAGSFGYVYKAEMLDKGRDAAIKTASGSVSSKKQLENESDILKSLRGCRHVPLFYDCGIFRGFRYLAMKLQGPSIQGLQDAMPGGKFTLSTTLRVGKQAIKILKCIHGKGYIHQDIKPANFLTGFIESKRHRMYLTDFGLSAHYRMLDGSIRPPGKSNFIGTYRFASKHTHKGMVQGRRDDLWSLFYMLVNLNSNLPWDQLRNRENIREMKETCDNYALASMFPGQFKTFIDELVRLSYADEPNYDLLESVFASCMEENGFREEDPYDWDPIHESIRD